MLGFGSSRRRRRRFDDPREDFFEPRQRFKENARRVRAGNTDDEEKEANRICPHELAFRITIRCPKRQARERRFQLVRGRKTICLHIDNMLRALKEEAHSAKEAKPRSELRGVDSDAAAITQLVTIVGNIEDIEPRFQTLLAMELQSFLNSQADRIVSRHGTALGDRDPTVASAIAPQSPAR